MAKNLVISEKTKNKEFNFFKSKYLVILSLAYKNIDILDVLNAEY